MAILLCKGKRQHLLTSKVSKYCLLLLQARDRKFKNIPFFRVKIAPCQPKAASLCLIILLNNCMYNLIIGSIYNFYLKCEREPSSVFTLTSSFFFHIQHTDAHENHLDDKSPSRPDSILDHASRPNAILDHGQQTWKHLSPVHWPTLMGYYNISLLGR